MNWTVAVVAAVLGVAGPCRAEDVAGSGMLRPLKVPDDAGSQAGSDRLKPELPRIGTTLRPWPLPPRPSWAWPPSARPSWVWAPGSPALSWIWQPGPPLEASGTIRIAATMIAPPMTPKPPPWLQDVSRTVIVTTSVPPWPPLPPPDFRLPRGRSRFADQKNLEPPPQFVRWSDRLENVLPGDREVDQRCRAVGAKSPPGKIIRGCSRRVAGRCLIIRVDDPGVARHELAHCNGWRHE